MSYPIIIAHAGGIIHGHGYTNSLQACEHSLAAGFRFIELDVVALNDGYTIAHDETEQKFYDWSKAFHDTSLGEFTNLKVVDRFTPMTFELLDGLTRLHPQATWILDTKFSNAMQLEEFLTWLLSNFSNLAKNCVIQVYNRADAAACVKIGAMRVLFALWKNYNQDYLGELALAEIHEVLSLKLEMLGVSLRCYRDNAATLSNVTDPRITKLRDLGLPILLHDLKDLDANWLLNQNFGLFTHSATKIAPSFLLR